MDSKYVYINKSKDIAWGKRRSVWRGEKKKKRANGSDRKACVNVRRRQLGGMCSARSVLLVAEE